MQKYFYSLSDYITDQIKKDEIFLANFGGEDSDFVRLNHNKIRQGGSVTQYDISLTLIKGNKHASHALAITNDEDEDKAVISKTLELLRDRLDVLPDDPYLMYSTDVKSTEQKDENRLPKSEDAIDNSTTTILNY